MQMVANILYFVVAVITIALHTFLPLCAGVLNVCMHACVHACMYARIKYHAKNWVKLTSPGWILKKTIVY